MRSIPVILVLDDTVEDLRAVQQAVTAMGYEVIAGRDPASILRRLHTGEIDPFTGRLEMTQNMPSLAILDYEMHFAPDKSKSVEQLLSFLWEYHPDCRVVMYSSVLSHTDIVDRINQRHPAALLHPKRPDSVQALVSRILKVVGKRVGELEVVGPRIRYTAPGVAGEPPVCLYFTHPVWYRLVSHYPAAVLVQGENESRTVRRFRDRLRELGSSVSVARSGKSRFRLTLTGGGDGDLPDDGAILRGDPGTE